MILVTNCIARHELQVFCIEYLRDLMTHHLAKLSNQPVTNSCTDKERWVLLPVENFVRTPFIKFLAMPLFMLPFATLLAVVSGVSAACRWRSRSSSAGEL